MILFSLFSLSVFLPSLIDRVTMRLREFYLWNWKCFYMVSELGFLSMAFAQSGSSSSLSSSSVLLAMATLGLPVNSSLLLLSNMSSMMTVKLDYGNYIVWKHQIEVILDTYSMIDVLNSITPPNRFLKDSSGNFTTEIVQHS